MNPRDDLLPVYASNPSALGLTTAGEVAALIKKFEIAVDIDDEGLIFHTVRARLLRIERGVLRGQVEKFTAPGQLSVEQGIQVRLTDLRRELAESEAFITAFNSGDASSEPGGFWTVPTVTRW